MKTSTAKKLSRARDGALTPGEQERLVRETTGDAEAERVAHLWEAAGGLLREGATRTATPDPALAWQAIRREIRNKEAEPVRAAVRGWPGGWAWASGLAAVLVAGGLTWWGLARERATHTVAQGVAEPDRVAWVVAEIPGATTMIYTDAETDLTVIWMELAQKAEPKDT